MISLVTHAADLPRVRGPFSLRIAAAAKAYGLEAPFLDVWQGNGCWFSRMDGVLTLAGVPEPEGREETRLFLEASGAGEIFCAPEAAAALGLIPDQEGPVLWRKQPGERGPLLGEQPSPRAIYPILEACRGPYFPVPPFEPFYLDLSHRFRHGAAAGVVLEEAGDGCGLCGGRRRDRGSGPCSLRWRCGRNSAGKGWDEKQWNSWVPICREGSSISSGPKRRIRPFTPAWGLSPGAAGPA